MMEALPRGFYILNTIRCCSVISLLSAIASAIISVVKSFVVTKFYFFDAINSIFLSIFCGMLIMSELSIYQEYFDRRWPLLGSKSSLVTVGISEFVVGFLLLGNLNETAASKQNLGYSFNTLLTSTGVIVIFVGVVNVIASYVYSDSLSHITARMARSRRLMKEVVQTGLQKQHQPSFAPTDDNGRSAQITMPVRSYSTRSHASGKSQETIVSRTASARSSRRDCSARPDYSISSWYTGNRSDRNEVAKEFV